MNFCQRLTAINRRRAGSEVDEHLHGKVGAYLIGAKELSIDGDAFIAPGPRDVGDGKFQAVNFKKGLELGRAIVSGRGQSIPKYSGVKQNELFGVSNFFED